MSGRSARRRVVRLPGTGLARDDAVAVEEPLEIRVDGSPLTVTMRTPGHDVELVHGFLVSEGVVVSPDDVVTAAYCGGAVDGVNRYNQLDVTLSPSAAAVRPVRHVLTTSACGLCGRTSLEEVRTRAPYALDPDVRFDPQWITTLPDRLREAQAVFDKTGGLHAAGLFAAAADRPLVVREDVGRHNAVDKVVGARLLAGGLPASGSLLLVSGRASFELVQKAVVAGIPALAAVSAPSSLAVDLALETGLTLVGFLRGEHMNVYSGGHRLGL